MTKGVSLDEMDLARRSISVAVGSQLLNGGRSKKEVPVSEACEEGLLRVVLSRVRLTG